LSATTEEFIRGFDQFGQVGQNAVSNIAGAINGQLIPSIQNAIALMNQLRVPAAPVARNSGGPTYLAQGGFVNTMLTPGEMIFDPKFTAKNLSTLMAMNRSARPKGTDTVQAILPAGSFVLNKGAVEKYFAGGGFLPFSDFMSAYRSGNLRKTKINVKEYQDMLDALLDNKEFGSTAYDYFGTTVEGGEFQGVLEMFKMMKAAGYNTGGKVQGIGKHSVQYLRTGGMTLDPTIIPQMRGTTPTINKSSITNNNTNQANANTNQNVTINLQGSNISTEQQAIQLGKAFQRQIRLGRLK
jgi:hypothetical protein